MPMFKIYFQWEVYQINILFKCWITGSKTSFFCWNWDQRQVSQPRKGISRIQENIWHKNCSCYDLTIKCSQFDILLQKQWFLIFLDYDILMWQSFTTTHKELTNRTFLKTHNLNIKSNLICIFLSHLNFLKN